MQWCKQCLLFAVGAITGLTAGASGAQALPSVEDFFRPPAYAQVELSPDATALAALAPIHDRANLVVIDLATRKPAVITSRKDDEVSWFHWVNARRLVFAMHERKRSDGQRIWLPGVHAIDKDGGRSRTLSGFSTLEMQSAIVGADPLSDLVIATEWTEAGYRVAHFDTVQNWSTPVTDRVPGPVVGWWVDRHGVARAATTRADPTAPATAWLRKDAASPWQKMVSWDEAAETDWRASLSILGFDFDGSLIVSARNAQGLLAIYLWDEQSNQLGLELASHPKVDVFRSNLVFDPRKRKLVGVRIDADRPEYHWVDDDWARWHAGLSRALPGLDVRMSRAGGSDLLLVHASSDREPGAYYLFDPTTRKLEPLVRERPWIDPKQMGVREPITYRARDGRSIPGYLTLPPGREAKDLPLVVLVHGGPFVHGDRWQWDAEAQFLATRGYAVLQPAFRGTLGYGVAHAEAGWRQWGQKMQDDLNDGVLHLAARGTVDAKRACIMGSSYGGYAALMGVARDPGFWRCAISFAGVTDLLDMSISSISEHDGWSDDWMRKHVGDPKTERDMLRRLSPLFLADRIREPVLLATGSDDFRVPMRHGVRMRNALRQHGVSHEWKLYDTEVHGFSRDDYKYDFYARVERFLAKHLAAPQ